MSGDMQSAEKPSRELIDLYRSGDQAAADELFKRYSERIWRLAEQQMGPRLRRHEDPDDVVQSVFNTFFRRAKEGEFRIDHSGALWRLLMKITANKVRSHGKYHDAKKRGGKQDGLSPELLEVIDREPSHEEAVALTEELEAAVDGFHERDLEIVRYAFEGYSTGEIGKKMDCTRQTVGRVRKQIGQRLEGRLRRYSVE